MRALAAAALLTALAGSASAAETTLELYGERSRARHLGTGPILRLDFASRADQVLTGATLRLEVARERRVLPDEPVRIELNGEPLRTLRPEELLPGGGFALRIPARLLAGENQLLLRRESQQTECGRGDWRWLDSVSLDVKSRSLPLADSLDVLPLPFLDPRYDDSAEIPVVLASGFDTEQVRVAGWLASWFGVQSPGALRFPVRIGALGEGNAVVVAAGEEELLQLGIEPPPTPGVSLRSHPAQPGGTAKLLLVYGTNAEELRAAATELLSRGGPLPDRPAPYTAPRWAKPGPEVRLGELPNVGPLAHVGQTDGAIRVRFRVAPDLWLWPGESVRLDLGYVQALPPGVGAPRLDVIFNGEFLASLPPVPPDEPAGRASLIVPRERFRGFNELLVHVAWAEPACKGEDDGARVALTRDSALRLDGLEHFVMQPDVARFVDDGLPFTRLPDLSQTVALLPEEPAAEELATLLSVLAHTGQITGLPATGLRVERLADAEAAGRDADLLLVAASPASPALEKWADRLPLGTSGAQIPSSASTLSALLRGGAPLVELRRAHAVFSAIESWTAVVAAESPFASDRTLLVITASGREALTGVDVFSGHAEGRPLTGDLLVHSGGSRWLFALGTPFGTGELGPVDRLRWAIATHWVLLPIGIVLCSLVLGTGLRRFLGRRERERLGSRAQP